MKGFTVFLVILGITLTACRPQFPNIYREIKTKKFIGDAGDPLILTPYIEQNRIEEAQALAAVDSNYFHNVRSYSGYFTVDKSHNSNLFFWFFPAYENYENAPVILWLQGGPGATSLFGLFEENGPFILEGNLQLGLRESTWARTHSVIYIDNPVGTGFSFTNGGYAENQTKVGEDLYSALQQFFSLFPNLRSNEFYISGESYGGKYVPAIAYTILQNSPQAEKSINLQGISIGNGLSAPEYQLMYGDRLYQLGLIDAKVREQFKNYERQVVDLIHQQRFDEVGAVLNDMINGGPSSLFGVVTGYENVYNFLYNVDVEGNTHDGYLQELVDDENFRRNIHVGSTDFGDPRVSELLANDIPKSVTPWVSEILNYYRVLIYNGQMDILVSYPSTEDYLQNLEFRDAAEYRAAERKQWHVGDDLAGYVKTAGSLTDVMVRNSGHMVPTDQPKWALDLITKFIRNEKLTN